MNILLLDSGAPLETAFTLPAGLLREPVSAAGRADVVISNRCHRWHGDGKPCHRQDSSQGLPLSHRPGPPAGGEPEPFFPLKGVRVMAFSGTAAPSHFLMPWKRKVFH